MDKVKYNKDGLVPTIALDNETGVVLMLAYMNEEALSLTLSTGKVHYYSRSREKLWLKGETSGHFQEVVSVSLDCDYDAVLVRVKQIGNACHTGEYSCFFNHIYGDKVFGYELMANEEKGIQDRKVNPKEKSYTNYLLDCGIDKICKKIGEEAAETIIAAKNHNKEELAGEVADLFYHVQVLLASENMTMNDVFKVMHERSQKQSNLKEKNEKGDK